MLIALKNGITIEPCTFTAVIGPERAVIDMINDNPDLQRYLFLFISGNFSRILSSIQRTGQNFEIRRPFTAHQLYTTLREAAHTVIFIEHDPTMFDGAWDMIKIIAGALRQISHETTIIIYSPTMDRAFSALIQDAPRVICLTTDERGASRQPRRNNTQMTLDIG
jgi:hypothetical protein